MVEYETHPFSVPLACRYLVHTPQKATTSNPQLVLTLHGYGSNPEAMLRLTLLAVGADTIVASLQAPFQQYVGPTPGGSDPGYNWGVRQHHEEAIRLHHEMVRTVLKELSERFHLTPSQCILMGFSQPVGLNYRFVGTHPGEVGGVIGICGGVPRDWEESKYQPVAVPLLHISRDADEFFPAEKANQFPDRLRQHASTVEFHMLPGGHRFPSKAASIIQPWMARFRSA